jgi:hypothetical protein
MEIQVKDGCLGMSIFQIVYRNRHHKHIPVTNQFPQDTDYTWNRLGVAQFHVVPGRMLALVLGDRIVRPSWQLKGWIARLSRNQLEISQTQAREMGRNETGRKDDN